MGNLRWWHSDGTGQIWPIGTDRKNVVSAGNILCHFCIILGVRTRKHGDHVGMLSPRNDPYRPGRSVLGGQRHSVCDDSNLYVLEVYAELAVE